MCLVGGKGRTPPTVAALLADFNMIVAQTLLCLWVGQSDFLYATQGVFPHHAPSKFTYTQETQNSIHGLQSYVQLMVQVDIGNGSGARGVALLAVDHFQGYEGFHAILREQPLSLVGLSQTPTPCLA